MKIKVPYTNMTRHKIIIVDLYNRLKDIQQANLGYEKPDVKGCTIHAFNNAPVVQFETTH